MLRGPGAQCVPGTGASGGSSIWSSVAAASIILLPGPDAAAGETIPPVPRHVLGGFGRPHELAHDPDEAGRVGVMREVSGLVEDLELAAREGEMGQAGVAERDDGVAPAPDDQGGHALGQVGPIEHGDDLALPVHPRTQRAQDRSPCLGVGQGVEDGEHLLGVAAECGIEDAQQARAQAADQLDRRGSEERHERLGARDRRHPQQRAHRTAHSPAPHQDEALATLRELVGELGRHAAAERMAQHRGAVDLEHAQEVPHPVGIPRHRVVGPRLLRTTMAEQVRRHDGVVLGQLLEHGAPAVRAVADAVDEQQHRPRARFHVGAAVPVHGDVAHPEGTFAAHAGPVADGVGVDGGRAGVPGGGGGRASASAGVSPAGAAGVAGAAAGTFVAGCRLGLRHLVRAFHADLPTRSGWRACVRRIRRCAAR